MNKVIFPYALLLMVVYGCNKIDDGTTGSVSSNTDGTTTNNFSKLYAKCIT
ncbi:MAG: hypothetical protein IPL55_24345 [Saprospiraceae bacterium]|nr:hypothetical protein [Saprospiraceae bacterium]